MDDRDKPGQTASEQVARLRETEARLRAGLRAEPAIPADAAAELTARLEETEAQLREILDAMHKAVEAAGLAEETPRKRHLRLVHDADREAG